MRLAASSLIVALVACRPPAPPIDIQAPMTIESRASSQIVPVAEPGTPQPQTALDRVAAAAARAAASDHVVSAHAVRAAMATELGSGMWPHVLTGWGTDAEIAAQLAVGLGELHAAVEIVEIGVAAAQGEAGRVGVIVALPLPRLPLEVARGSQTARITLPWIWAEEASAHAVTPTTSKRLDPKLMERVGERFELAVDCTRPAAIEIRAGTRVVASVVDACGAPVDAEVAGELDVGPPARTRVEIERRVFELLNRERVAHDRPPLAWDPVAHRFAREHADDMALFAFVGHQASDGSSMRRRVEQAPFRSAATRENVGHAWGPGEVHAAFMTSAGHRENVLAYDIERGAVGITFDPSDPRAFYVTQLFRTP